MISSILRFFKLKEQLLAARDQLHKFETKSYELQPTFMKNNNQVNFKKLFYFFINFFEIKNQYNAIFSTMQQLSASLMSSEEAAKIDWSKFNYENLADEFSKNNHKEVSDFIAHLKKLLEDCSESNTKKIAKIETEIADKNLLIRELENNKSQVIYIFKIFLKKKDLFEIDGKLGL